MKIIFRADASIEIGSGHVMRCLTLADALHEQGHDCVFLCREHTGNLIELIENRGFLVLRLPVYSQNDNRLAHAKWLGATQAQDARDSLAKLTENELARFDWLVVDHYALDKQWENEVGKNAQKCFVIDDLADRAHECDVLLDQNLGREKSDYQTLVPNQCQCLIGAKYALLRPEFAQWRVRSLSRRQKNPVFRKLLINLGGVDKDNITGCILQALVPLSLPENLEITVIMGATAPHLSAVETIAKKLPWHTDVLVNVSDMARQMAMADLAIGAAGSTSWERCCLGLPTLMFVLADNQKRVASVFEQQKLALRVEKIENFSDKLSQLIKIKSEISKNCAQLVDGVGCQKVLERLEKK